jgi:hypothetical protein
MTRDDILVMLRELLSLRTWAEACVLAAFGLAIITLSV